MATQERTITGIQKEREMLSDIRARSQMIVNTTDLSPRQLREKIIEVFASDTYQPFHIEMVSFGFKFGVPIDADIVMDVRFLPNPHYVDELRPKTGLDTEVYDYVMKQPETEEFYSRFMNLIKYCLPGYKKEGKSSVTIAIGCTGGKHRSVALAKRMGQELENDHYVVNVSHRDKLKNKESVNRS